MRIDICLPTFENSNIRRSNLKKSFAQILHVKQFFAQIIQNIFDELMPIELFFAQILQIKISRSNSSS